MTENKQHPHAEFLRALADGEPLDAFEAMSRSSDDECRSVAGWIAQISLYPDRWQVRRKPRKIKIGDMEIDPPMRVAPPAGTKYWKVVPTNHAADEIDWRGDALDRIWLDSGMCHATKEAAEAHRRALILVSGGTP